MKQQQKLQCLLRETKKARPCRGLNRETPCHPVSLGNQGNFARSEVSRVKQGTKEPRKQHAARSFRGEPGKRGNGEIGNQAPGELVSRYKGRLLVSPVNLLT